MNIAKLINGLPTVLRRHKLVQLLLLFFPQSRLQVINFNSGAQLIADVSNPLPRQCLLTKSFEPEFFAITQPFLTKGGIFFDVGANFGFCSFGLIDCLDKKQIEYHLFEANPNICYCLQQSAQLHPQEKIKINNCCVTNTEGSSKLKIHHQQLASSYIADVGDYQVSNLVLDQYISENGIEKIKLLKMDIEGWEPFALQGLSNSLKRGLIEVIYLEVSWDNLARNNFNPEDCFQILRATGFQLFYCKPDDFAHNIADSNKKFKLPVNNHSVTLAPLENFPSQHQTDILAIHHQANLLN